MCLDMYYIIELEDMSVEFRRDLLKAMSHGSDFSCAILSLSFPIQYSQMIGFSILNACYLLLNIGKNRHLENL